jgi:hypothetical protein
MIIVYIILKTVYPLSELIVANLLSTNKSPEAIHPKFILVRHTFYFFNRFEAFRMRYLNNK